MPSFARSNFESAIPAEGGGGDAAEEKVDSGLPQLDSLIQHLPVDALHNVLFRLPLLEAVACRLVCRVFRDVLSIPFLASFPPLRLLALRLPRAAAGPIPSLHVLDTSQRQWLRISLSFLPYNSACAITASPSLLYLWVEAAPADPAAGRNSQSKSLAVCNPLTGSHRLLPPLGSAWSRHGTVLAGPGGAVLVLTELAALVYAPGPSADRWLKFSLNLPSKPRSPILVDGKVFVLCDVGNPWRFHWKIFTCRFQGLGGRRDWAAIERPEWGDVFQILKRPRLLPGSGGRWILMIGGLRSTYAVDAPCSTVLILRLDLYTMEWDEAGRMPPDMYLCFSGGITGTMPIPAAAAAAALAAGNNKVKVFGGGGRVWLSGKRVRGKMAMWEEKEDIEIDGGGGRWSWVEGLPGYSEGVYRGFEFDAGFKAAT